MWGDSKFEFQCYWGLLKSKALLFFVVVFFVCFFFFWGGGGYVA